MTTLETSLTLLKDCQEVLTTLETIHPLEKEIIEDYLGEWSGFEETEVALEEVQELIYGQENY